MDEFLCCHGVKRDTTCFKCVEYVRSQDPGLLVDDGDLVLRIKSQCPEWWIWDMLPSMVVETPETVTKSEDVVVIPRADDIISSTCYVTMTDGSDMAVVIHSEPCYQRTCEIVAKDFPVDLYFGFSDERSIRFYSIILGGKTAKSSRSYLTRVKFTMDKPGDVVFATSDYRLRTKCFVRVNVTA